MRRRLLMTDRNEFPIEYIRLNYIRSTGTQYFDTDWKPTKNAKIDFDICMLSNSITPSDRIVPSIIFSAGNRTHTNQFQANFGEMPTPLRSTLFLWTDQTYREDVSVIYSNQFTLDELNSARSHLIVRATGVSSFLGKTMLSAKKTGDCTLNLLLLAENDGAKINILSGYDVQIYGCKIYDGETIVRNFIPAQRKDDGENGLYDTISKTFFINQGTGQFLYG